MRARRRRLVVASEEDRRAARILASLAITRVTSAPGEKTARFPLKWFTDGRSWPR
jgi:hypothetical protein